MTMKYFPAFRLNSLKTLPVVCLAWMLTGHVTMAWSPGNILAVGPKTVAVVLSAYPAVHHVAPTVHPETASDGSREKPWPSVAVALQHLKPGTKDHRIAVLVAAGTYDDATIQMREFIDLFGGYSADSWQREIFKHETVLDGQHARRVVIGANDARLDGFVVRRGRAFGHGGAILCDGTSPTISNNRIEESHTVQPVGFHADRIHQDGHRGGALACLFEATPVITNNLFIGNWTEVGDGGALAVYGWSRLPGKLRAHIESNVFVDNRSGTKENRRTRSSSGGAVAFSHEASPIFRNNIVAHNRSMGGSDAGGIYNEFYCSPTIENNWIVGNEAEDDGGGIYTMRMGEPLIRHNLIAGNETANAGVGGIRISKEGRARVVDNQIVRNQSGGGIMNVDGYLIAQGNLIADNLKGAGVGIRQSFEYFQPSRIENNRILNNEGGGISLQNDVGPPPVTTGNTIHEGAAGTNDTNLIIAGATFNRGLGQTVIQVQGTVGDAGTLASRIVWRGTQWSVVVTNRADTITVWGDLSAADANAVLHLVPQYPEF